MDGKNISSACWHGRGGGVICRGHPGAVVRDRDQGGRVRQEVAHLLSTVSQACIRNQAGTG